MEQKSNPNNQYYNELQLLEECDCCHDEFPLRLLYIAFNGNECYCEKCSLEYIFPEEKVIDK